MVLRYAVCPCVRLTLGIPKRPGVRIVRLPHDSRTVDIDADGEGRGLFDFDNGHDQPQKKDSCAPGVGGVTVLDCCTTAVAVTGRILRPAKLPPDTVE